MKMSDVFELPLNCGLVYNADVGYAIELEPEKSVTVEQACAVDYAINNHDHLTEENAKLREVLEFVIENSEPHSFVDFSEAQQLLNQLKEQNNDK